jgi:transposase
VELGLELWFNDPPSRADAAALTPRGKKGGGIACALADRAARTARRWSGTEVPCIPFHHDRR